MDWDLQLMALAEDPVIIISASEVVRRAGGRRRGWQEGQLERVGGGVCNAGAHVWLYNLAAVKLMIHCMLGFSQVCNLVPATTPCFGFQSLAFTRPVGETPAH